MQRRPVPRWPALPGALRRGRVVVEDFVPVDEAPPVWWCDDPGWWRQLRAWRRWQAAVAEFGAASGMDRAALRAAGYWPQRPPPFRTG